MTMPRHLKKNSRWKQRNFTQLYLTDLWQESRLKNVPLHSHNLAQGENCDDLTRSAPAEWPNVVADFVEKYLNPAQIEFDSVEPFGMCSCDSRCRFGLCPNSKTNTYCDSNCCLYEGICGNGFKSCVLTELRRSETLFGHGVYASERIDAGVIVGEYFGELKILSEDEAMGHGGYLYQMKARSKSHPDRKVFVDAENSGGVMRFLNHSCVATARFEELCNCENHRVAIVTNRIIDRGEQITVNYGSRLWFACRCGEPECRSRAIGIVG